MGDPNTNQDVLVWARGKIGRQVGKGECWDLADQALKKAGAESSTTTGKDDDYVWGDEIPLKDAQPGDVLQFRDFTVTTRVDTKVTYADGSGSESWSEKKANRGHHTAIVDAVTGPNELKVLEQHVKPGGKKVQVHKMPLRSDTTPQTTTYEDVKDDKGKIHHGAKVVRTVKVTVTGKVKAYRPKKKSK
jgi:hypothetical protein